MRSSTQAESVRTLEAKRSGTSRHVLLYELNELPWSVVDLYVERRPRSTLAATLPHTECLTSHDADPEHLSPWRTWPTFHTGLYTHDHNSWELGQDPNTFRGEPIWDVAEREGLSVGMFGVLQSWPPRERTNGGFWIPDTFAQDARTVPHSLTRFQAFNLSMTADNAFSANAPLNGKQMLAVGMDLLTKGLTPSSAARLARQIVRERQDTRWKAARPMAQALPAFDLFWRLHRRTAPDLSMFFTNHVAGVMHRYWGDAVPGYAERYQYPVDDVFGQFLFEALDIFDSHLRRLVSWVKRDSSNVLVIASSMGQEPIAYEEVDRCYVLRDSDRMSRVLSLPSNHPALAMYPKYAWSFETGEDAQQAAERLKLVRLDDKPFFEQVLAEGRTVTTAVTDYRDGKHLTISSSDAGPSREIRLDDFGISLEERLGGANTAYHVPDGIWIAIGEGITPDLSRAMFDIREAKQRVLALLGIPSSTAQAQQPRSATR